MSDWADTEDHDFLNEFVGHRIDRIETSITASGASRLVVHTNRGRSLVITAESRDTGVTWGMRPELVPSLAIEEP